MYHYITTTLCLVSALFLLSYPVTASHHLPRPSRPFPLTHHPILATNDPASWLNTTTPMIRLQLTDDNTGDTASRLFPVNNEAYVIEYYFQETPMFLWEGQQTQQQRQRQQGAPRANISEGRPVLLASSGQLTRFQARTKFVCRFYRADWSVLGELDSRRTYIDFDRNPDRLTLVDLGDVRFSCES